MEEKNNMNNTTAKQDILIYGGLFLLALGVVFLSCLNPFGLNGIDSDTSAFLTIARGITKGQVPFRDFFDNKGPLNCRAPQAFPIVKDNHLAVKIKHRFSAFRFVYFCPGAR
jgi:hypothetical protein